MANALIASSQPGQPVALPLDRAAYSQLLQELACSDTHAAHIRDKLGLRSRAEIAAWVTRQGLR